jgi:GNAT superfamily N-acetyltransferase
MIIKNTKTGALHKARSSGMQKKPHPFFLETRDTFTFLVRPVQPADKGLMQRAYSELSDESRYFRFFGIQKHLTSRQLAYLTEVDGEDHVAWGILDVSEDRPCGVGIGRFVRLKESPEIAEIAVTVIDAYQRRGLGGILTAAMNILAGLNGIRIFRYYVLAENRFVLENIELLGVLKSNAERGYLILDTAVIPDSDSVPDDPSLLPFKQSMKVVESLMLEGEFSGDPGLLS